MFSSQVNGRSRNKHTYITNVSPPEFHEITTDIRILARSQIMNEPVLINNATRKDEIAYYALSARKGAKTSSFSVKSKILAEKWLMEHVDWDFVKIEANILTQVKKVPGEKCTTPCEKCLLNKVPICRKKKREYRYVTVFDKQM